MRARCPYTRCRLDSTRESSRARDAHTNILDVRTFVDVVDTSRRALCLHVAVPFAFLRFPPSVQLVPTSCADVFRKNHSADMNDDESSDDFDGARTAANAFGVVARNASFRAQAQPAVRQLFHFLSRYGTPPR